jgi:uncharacterized protein YuzE
MDVSSDLPIGKPSYTFLETKGLERQIPVVFAGNFDFENKNKITELKLTLYVMHSAICSLTIPLEKEVDAAEILGASQLLALNALQEGERTVSRNEENVFIKFSKTGLILNIDILNAEGKTDAELIKKFGVEFLIQHLVVKVQIF